MNMRQLTGSEVVYKIYDSDNDDLGHLANAAEARFGSWGFDTQFQHIPDSDLISFYRDFLVDMET